MTYTSRILFWSILAMAFAMQARAAKTVEIPFEINESGHLILEATLNGDTPVDAVIDTGATYALIDHSSALQLGIVPLDMTDTIDIIGIGEASAFPTIDLSSVRIGAVELGQMKAAYNERFAMPGARNVIPSSSLPHRTLDFDFSESRLTLYDRRPSYLSDSVASDLAIDWIGGLPFVSIRVNGREGLAMIDTGASISFINSAFAENAARSKDSIRTFQLIGSTGIAEPIRVLSSRNFQIGRFKSRQINVVVADPPFLDAHGLSDQPVMVLGLDILMRFRLQIDREKDLVIISQPIEGYARLLR